MANPNEAAKKATDKVENKTEETLSNVQDKVEAVKGQASDAISAGGAAVQRAKETAQNFVSDKADQISSYANQAYDKASETATKLGSKASEAISSSADYVKNIDVDKARETVKTAVQDKPELSIVIAALTGLVIGLIIGRTGGGRSDKD